MNKVISKNGTAIAFDRLGKGQPIILVDGALCSRSFGPMSKLAPLLAENFTVINYDRRGWGDSGDTKPYTVEREIEDLEALIKEAGGSTYLLGLSSGAALALRAAASVRHVTKLALYEPPFVAMGDNGHQPPADHEAQLNQLISSGRPGDAVKFFLTKVVGFPVIFFFVIRLLPVWSKLKAVAPSLPYDAAVMGDYSLPAKVVASVTVPTLVIGGEKSQVELHRAVRAVADVLPDASCRMLKGQTHNVSVKVLAPVLMEFFAG